MKNLWIHSSALGLAAVALAASPLLASPEPAIKPLPRPAETKPATKPGAPGGQMDPMQEAWTKASTPGMEHKKLAEIVGTWDMVVTATMMPGAPPGTSKGKATYKMIDDRFLHEDVQSEMMGQPFHGTGITGYDNVTKKYFNAWMDNMGTGMMTSTGTAAADGTVTMVSEFPDPMTGKMQKSRMIIKHMGPDKKTFEMYGLGPDGKEFKNLEIAYTRAK